MFRAVLVSVLAVTAGSLLAAEPARRARGGAEARQVELFSAIDAGELEVRFIPKNAQSANVMIRNKTDQPLTVRLPEAFAGVPVLAQPAGGAAGAANLGGAGGGGGGGGQGVGGGFGGGGMGGGGFGGMGGGGFFNVAPDKVGKVEVACICLEHGKEDPNPRMKYEIKPIGSFTQDERVIEVCKMLGRGEIPQNAAQAATWHLTDGLTWEALASKNRVELRTVNYFERFFNPRELALAAQIVREASRRTEGSGEQRTSEPYSSEQYSNRSSLPYAGR
jgi:hypothetical protein